MNTLFTGQGDDPRYIAVRDSDYVSDIKEESQRLWEKYSPYADPNFIDEFSRNFDARFWEMYLYEQLSFHHGEISSKSHGPDFLIQSSSQHVFMEATSATKGTGKDRVKDFCEMDRDDCSAQFRECALRVTSSFFVKANSNDAKSYAEGNPYIIAINLPFSEAWLSASPPLSALATMSVGSSSIIWGEDNDTREVLNYAPHIKKHSSEVPNNFFMNSEFSHISALIVASVNPFSSSYRSPSIEFLHNPFAQHPLKRGWLPIGREYWVENSSLTSRNWTI